MGDLISTLIRHGSQGNYEALEDAFELVRNLEEEGSVVVDGAFKNRDDELIYDEGNFNAAHEYAKEIRRLSALAVVNDGSAEMYELNKRCLLFDAKWDFDAYCRYIEWDREPRSRFYEPRRKQLKPLADALQDLEYGKLDLLCLSLPPGVGKTTLAIFYLTWISGREPNLQSLIGSHNNEFLRGVYDECYRIMSPDGEYLWGDVFPAVQIIGTNAKAMRLDLGKPKRFETLEFSGINSGNAGKVRATHLLYLDDLVEGIEQAMSKERMDNLWQKYTVDYRQRKQGNVVRELHIATRWSVHDPIGRLEMQYGNDPKAKFINTPALDGDNESNFDYPYGLGFSTEMYHSQRDIMDDVSWRALYMGQPIEREGQLYPPNELRRYFELPEGEPDAVLAVADTKDQGMDYFAMPIVYQYGNDFYVEDWICDNSTPDVCEERAISKLLKHKVKIAQFESNRAGGRIAAKVQEEIKNRGGITRITTKWNQANKETRIIVESGFVKQNFLFKDDSVCDKEYRTAMMFLEGYTMMGKKANKHDDIPDAIAQFSTFVQSLSYGQAKLFKRTF